VRAACYLTAGFAVTAVATAREFAGSDPLERTSHLLPDVTVPLSSGAHEVRLTAVRRGGCQMNWFTDQAASHGTDVSPAKTPVPLRAFLIHTTIA
jgi:hypothetical protein